MRRRCSAQDRHASGAKSISRSRRRAFAVAAGFCAAVSLGEFGATLFIARPDWPTVPIAISRFLARPGQINVDQSLAMSVILMGLTAVVVFAIERVRVRDLGEL